MFEFLPGNNDDGGMQLFLFVIIPQKLSPNAEKSRKMS